MSLQVREAMRSQPHTIGLHVSVAELERALLTYRVGGLPVVEEGVLLGIACRSDILRALGYERSYAEQICEQEAQLAGESTAEGPWTDRVGATVGKRLQQLTVADVMVRDVQTVAPDESLDNAAKRMAKHVIHRLPVVEDGQLVGILTSLDLARLVVEGRLRAV